MMNPYSSLSDDFYVNMHLHTEMDLPKPTGKPFCTSLSKCNAVIQSCVISINEKRGEFHY